VEVARVNSSVWAVGIRGFGSAFSKSVLVLIDGRSVYTPLFAGVEWNVQSVLLEDVERIEVIRGPGGTIWGSNAVSGVINIITKSAKDTRGAYASTSGGNMNQSRSAVRYGGGRGNSFNYRAYAMGFGEAPEFHRDGDNYDDWQLGQAGFRTDPDRRTVTRLPFRVIFTRTCWATDQHRLLLAARPTECGRNTIRLGRQSPGRWHRELSHTSDLQLQAYYDRTYRLGPQLGETRNTFDLDFIHHLVLKQRNEIIWGLGARWSPSSIVQTVATVDFVPHHMANNIYSAFVQDQIAILQDKIWLTVGFEVRAQHLYRLGEPAQRASVVDADLPSNVLGSAITRGADTFAN
jgi:iron complex outermembrane receptor protein